MTYNTPAIWKEAPFIRLLLPFITGIFLQWCFDWSLLVYAIITTCCLIAFFIFIVVKTSFLFKYYWLTGIFINIMLCCGGGALTFLKNIQHDALWVKNYHTANNMVVITLEEPLSEKNKSYKANASINYLYNKKLQPVKGSMIVYFQKDSSVNHLLYGSQITFYKPLQEIKNSGNPGAFDYKRYCAFQSIYHQVFLKKGEYTVLPAEHKNFFKSFLLQTREKVLSILRTYIPGQKESGLAEALLIGYKDDLDKTLVQAYSNTGVVHVIAISGLHVGIIYWLLTLLCRPFLKHKKLKWVKPIIIIAGLWLFSLLAGGSPSILRSAVMFTCIVLGESFSRKISIYNSLAASAFILLCINPYWLWDVGFQLSYVAVLSIVVFMKPIYNLLYVKNKLLDAIWKLNAVTLAAQILTVPISIYHFHQFPNLFLITNLLAVPLSSLVVIIEIVLCAVSFIPVVAKVVGYILHWLIWIMNSFIERMEAVSFATWDHLQISTSQLVFIYMAIIALAIWLLLKQKKALQFALVCVTGFVALRSMDLIQATQQNRIVVYNVPQHQAIDVMQGTNYHFIGDSLLLENDFLQNFHLKPSRILHRVKEAKNFDGFLAGNSSFQFRNTRILLIDKAISKQPSSQKIKADLVIVSHNPKIYMQDLLEQVDCRQVVFDASNPAWKIDKWKADCERLGISYYSVVDKGAFVMNLN